MTIEELQEENLKLKEKVQAMTDSLASEKILYTSVETERNDLQDQVKKLQEHNMRLYLQVDKIDNVIEHSSAKDESLDDDNDEFPKPKTKNWDDFLKDWE